MSCHDGGLFVIGNRKMSIVEIQRLPLTPAERALMDQEMVRQFNSPDWCPPICWHVIPMDEDGDWCATCLLHRWVNGYFERDRPEAAY